MTELLLRGALANVGKEVSSDDLLTFLNTKTKDVEYYRFSPTPGHITSAAFDWIAIIATTASIITIAGALWSAYKHFIIPLRKKNRKDAFLYISIKNEDGNFTQFSIGNEFDDKEVFIEEFVRKTETLKLSLNQDEVHIEKQYIVNSKNWIKIRGNE